jgi:choline dehydrogenase-like flavoprotein
MPLDNQSDNRSLATQARRIDVLVGAETTYHPVGTCKMGSDPMAVVPARYGFAR